MASSLSLQANEQVFFFFVDRLAGQLLVPGAEMKITPMTLQHGLTGMRKRPCTDLYGHTPKNTGTPICRMEPEPL